MIKLKRYLALLMVAALISAIALLGFLVIGQNRILYFPRPYPPEQVVGWDREPGTTVIRYLTSDGPQHAYLLSPAEKPERLWIVCGGNGTLALEWSDRLREHGPPRDAWLLFDMPGYGDCGGLPDPASIRRSLQNVVPAAAVALDWKLTRSDPRLRFFGHSLGSAVCLMAACEYDIRRGVLLTPFTSTMEMTRVVFGAPLGFLVLHRFDNRARLQEIAARGTGGVFVIHGTGDEVIPMEMSRDLAKEFPSLVRLTEIPGGRHNNLQEIVPGVIAGALENAR